MAEGRKWTPEELAVRHAASRRATRKAHVVVVCEHIRSALNVGSIFRSADAFGVHGLWLCGITATPPHREIQKTALGATETVPWVHEPDPLRASLKLCQAGYALIGIEQTTTSRPLHRFIWPEGPLALFLGNEVEGLSSEVLATLDACAEIPQIGTKHSLNVAVAAGVVLWEVFRLRA